jgi:hypothetical protein
MGFTPFRWLASKIRSKKEAQPPAEAPLYFSTDDRASFWSSAKRGESSGTQVVGHWHVTNVSNRDFVLLKVRLEGYEATHSHVLTKGPEEAGTATYTSRNPCAARYMSRVLASKITWSSATFALVRARNRNRPAYIRPMYRVRPVNAPAAFIHPCRTIVVAQPPSGYGWAHELKHDGIGCRFTFAMSG